MEGTAMTPKHFLLAVEISALFWCGAAYGHAMLESSAPANNAVLHAAPKSIDLTFGHPTKLLVLKLQKENGDIPLAVDGAAAPAKSFSIPLPALTPGKYKVAWGTIAADGHAMKGAISFTILGH
jgi:methionine-rich copper-binding protein CopC